MLSRTPSGSMPSWQQISLAWPSRRNDTSWRSRTGWLCAGINLRGLIDCTGCFGDWLRPDESRKTQDQDKSYVEE